jgi:hypothetical protein
VPLQPLPSLQFRERRYSPQVRQWLADLTRTKSELAAFDEASLALKEGRWGAVSLAASFIYVDYWHASMSTGERIIVRFGMVPPLAAVFLLYVGKGDELEGWKPSDGFQ